LALPLKSFKVFCPFFELETVSNLKLFDFDIDQLGMCDADTGKGQNDIGT
jgi:hypothetical protein